MSTADNNRLGNRQLPQSPLTVNTIESLMMEVPFFDGAFFGVADLEYWNSSDKEIIEKLKVDKSITLH
jgi:hypothetical protein